MLRTAKLKEGALYEKTFAVYVHTGMWMCPDRMCLEGLKHFETNVAKPLHVCNAGFSTTTLNILAIWSNLFGELSPVHLNFWYNRCSGWESFWGNFPYIFERIYKKWVWIPWVCQFPLTVKSLLISILENRPRFCQCIWPGGEWTHKAEMSPACYGPWRLLHSCWG